MSRPVAVRLKTPAHEMAQEEILKQVEFLSRSLVNPRFTEGGAVLGFEAPEGEADDLAARAGELAARVQKGLRSLQRTVIYRSPAADRPTFRGGGVHEGVHPLGRGQVALDGLPLKLYRYFDRVFEGFGDPWRARPVVAPVLIPTDVLAKCDYFRSFPNNVTFACHLAEDEDRVENFRARHSDRDDVDAQTKNDLEVPEVCLCPAICYHIYHMNRGQTVPASGSVFGLCGRCFRYESGGMTGLRRLWDFTMREVVFLGGRDAVLGHRETSIGMMSEFLDRHQLAGEIRTASDPFFTAPDAMAKTYFQITSETKYEISLMLDENTRLAVGSHNYHTDFFGRAFDIDVQGGGPMHSVCVAFGLERWVLAFLTQHGDDPARWPDVVRDAPEFRD